MRRCFIFAIMLLGITTAHAQTGAPVGGVIADPLSVPTLALPRCRRLRQDRHPALHRDRQRRMDRRSEAREQ